MSNTSIVKYGFAAAATAVLAAVLLSGGAQASTTSKLLNCSGNTKDKVVSCCQNILNTKKRPVWMSSGSNSCAAAVKCSTKTVYPTAISYVAAPKKVKVCKLVIQYKEDNGKEPTKEPEKSAQQSYKP